MCHLRVPLCLPLVWGHLLQARSETTLQQDNTVSLVWPASVRGCCVCVSATASQKELLSSAKARNCHDERGAQFALKVRPSKPLTTVLPPFFQLLSTANTNQLHDHHPDTHPPGQLALWVGTSNGAVLLVGLTLPDSEDNRILQLQSINAEPIRKYHARAVAILHTATPPRRPLELFFSFLFSSPRSFTPILFLSAWPNSFPLVHQLQEVFSP